MRGAMHPNVSKTYSHNGRQVGWGAEGAIRHQMTDSSTQSRQLMGSTPGRAYGG